MKRSKNTPAPKTTKPAPKKGSAITEAVPKDAGATIVAKTLKEPKPRDPRLPAPGATIDREFKGKTYRLKFLDEGGVEVDGKVFSSLSAAARHVTRFASVNGFLWAGLISRDSKPAKSKPTKSAAPASTDGHPNALGEPAAQRAALKAAGLVKAPKGAPEQIASAAKARAARAAKKTSAR